jgi:transcriptional repressor NrdR
MHCPYCNKDNDKVIDSRATDGGKVIRRRRECLACGKRFTTYEHVEMTTKLIVIKKDGARVPYNRDKVLAGLQHACYKRPVSAEQMTKIVDEVEEEIFAKHDREVNSIEIGKAVSERLKTVDQVAYVRYASVYKRFRDLEDLLEEVQDVLKSGKPDKPEQGRLF